MANFYNELTETFRSFIQKQKVFFVATAPHHGRVNVSPKGMDTLRCIDDRTVAYLDLTGSGIETAAHIEENRRLTLMFCSFGDKPLILRLYGQGRAVRPRDPDWASWADRFPAIPGTRQVIVLAIESVQTSCGWGVPVMRFESERPTLRETAESHGEERLRAHWERSNQVSIDGLPSHLLE